VAFPVLFTMMNKRGNSYTAERIDLMERYIRIRENFYVIISRDGHRIKASVLFHQLKPNQFVFYRKIDCICLVLQNWTMSKRFKTDSGKKTRKKSLQLPKVWSE